MRILFPSTKVPVLIVSQVIVLMLMSQTRAAKFNPAWQSTSNNPNMMQTTTNYGTMGKQPETTKTAKPKNGAAVLDIDEITAPMKATYKSGENQTLEWRLKQLSSLHKMITTHKQDLCDAIHADLNKSEHESMYSEIVYLFSEIQFVCKRLKTWMEPERVATPAALAPCFGEVRRVPLVSPGVLVIAPFNYPVLLSLCPVIGAFAGGNPVVLKPSELSRAVSSLLKRIVPLYFDRGVFQVVEGGVEETTELMKHPWGLCFFTGSGRVGKIIGEAAAKTLTPTVLELGGKSPVYIAQDCPNNMRVVCDRLAQGKLMAAGQTCVGPDYVVCHETQIDLFCSEFQKSVQRMVADNSITSHLPRIVSSNHAQRHKDLIIEVEKSEPSAVVFGGSQFCNVSEKIIEPTLLRNPPLTCRVMQEEIFGPILSVNTVRSDEEAIEFINNMPGTPLALYIFTKSSARHEKILRACPSGAIVRNDALIHQTISELPFGGLGTSGMGAYTGKASFDTFTHQLANVHHPCIDPPFGLRYHPHGKTKGNILVKLFSLPSLPPLPTFTKLTTGAILCGLMFMPNSPMTPLTKAVAGYTADCLQSAATFLRQFD